MNNYLTALLLGAHRMPLHRGPQHSSYATSNTALALRASSSKNDVLCTTTRNTFCGTRYLSHCPTITVTFNPSLLKLYRRYWLLTKPQRYILSPLATSDIVSHVTIRFLMCGFLLVVIFNQPPFSHCFLRC